MPLFIRPNVGPSATVLARSALPPARALEIMAPISLPATFTGWGPFPPVLRVEDQTGGWDGVGQTRHPRLGDGGTVTETIVEYTPGVGFAYELTGFTDVFDRLIVGVRGEWTFTPDGDGTLVRWTWEFRPRFGRRLVTASVIVPLWRRYMVHIVRATVELAAREAASRPPRA